MLFIEIVLLLVVASVLITALFSVGRPMAEIMAEKTRFKFKGLDSEAEARLLKRIEAIEEELRQTNQRLIEIKDSAEFLGKIDTTSALETSNAETLNINKKND